MKIDFNLKVSDLKPSLAHFWDLAADKVKDLESKYDVSQGAPVFTVDGKYTTRGWTEWTQGFQFGIPLLIFEATGNKEMLALGKKNTVDKMSHHITHFGVHDHGFNNLSTYGNLLRLINSGKFEAPQEAKDFYTLALKSSASVQASRWTDVKDGG